MTRHFLLFSLLALAGCMMKESPKPQPQPIEEAAPAAHRGAVVPPPPKVIVADRKAVAHSDANLAIHLYQKLRAAEGNLVYSPASIAMGLHMAWAGAAGDTKKEMTRVLDIATPAEEMHGVDHVRLYEWNGADGKKRTMDLSVANSMWGQSGAPFEKEYLDLLEKRYASGFHQVDFAQAPEDARSKVNGWVADWTRGKIAELIPTGIFTANTRLVLANAIYFKGEWESPFEKDDTGDLPFHLASGKSVKVPTMHQKGHFRYGETDDAQILDMPYEGRLLSMAIILPKKRGGLADLEKALDSFKWSDYTRTFPQVEVLVYLPRFKFESSLQLQDSLAKMGMPKAFSSDDADFSKITGRKGLFLTHVLHKATIEVNEAGSEAAAATAVVGVEKSAPPDKKARQIPVFRADQPFLFAIRDARVGEILFLGRVADPSK